MEIPNLVKFTFKGKLTILLEPKLMKLIGSTLKENYI